MRRPLLWLAVGAALVVYLSFAWGVLKVGGGDATPEAVQQLEPVGRPSSSPAATSRAAASATRVPATPTPGPTPTLLPADLVAGQGGTFVLVNAGVVTYNTKVGLTGQGFKP